MGYSGKTGNVGNSFPIWGRNGLEKKLMKKILYMLELNLWKAHVTDLHKLN